MRATITGHAVLAWGANPPWDPRWPKAAFLRHGALAVLARESDPRDPGGLRPRSSRALAVLAGVPRHFPVAFSGRGSVGRHRALLAWGGNRLGTRRWHGGWAGGRHGLERSQVRRLRAVLRWLHPEHPVDGVPVHGLVLQQQVHHAPQVGLMRPQQADRLLLGLAEQPGDLAVDLRLGGLREGPAGHALPATAEEHRTALRVTDRADAGGQPELADHLDGEVGRRGQVVGRTGRSLAELDQFGGPPAQPHGQGLVQVVLAVKVPFDQDRKSTRLNSSHVRISYAV